MNYRMAGIPFVVGIQGMKPIKGLSGKLRVRMRHDEFARVTQKTPEGVRRWHIIDKGDHWEPYGLPEINQTVKL